MKGEKFTKDYYDSRTIKEFGEYNTIYSLDDLNFLEDLIKHKFGTGAGYGMFFRGEGNSSWDITPTTAREIAPSISGLELQKAEEELLNTFINRLTEKNSINILQNRKDTGNVNLNNWYMLTQAQHGRLKTTLIDFTNNFRLAFYFAVEDVTHDEQDAQIWLLVDFHQKLIINDTVLMRYNPFDLQEDLLIAPTIISDHILQKPFHHNNSMQHGLFIKQKSINCNLPLNQNEKFCDCLFRFIIPASEKQTLRKDLQQLFPKGLYNKVDKIIKNIVEKCNKIRIR